ncbi:MAG: helix-turn-helix domain-containing protein [Chloroflexota bacterium]|nr:helix-turn-helix domain-containing protein [Chloroflexota bacterium]
MTRSTPSPSSTPVPVGNLLTFQQVAQRLGVNRTTVYTFIQQGLPVTRLGTRTIRFDENDLNAWLIQCKTAS